MASLVRVTHTCYHDADGRRCLKGTPGAVKVSRKAAKWYSQGVPGMARTRRLPLSADRKLAERMLARMVENAERGNFDLPAVGDDRVSLVELLGQFAEHMFLGLASKVRGKCKMPAPEQVSLCVQRVRDILRACRFETAQSLNTDATATLAKWLQTRRTIPKKEGGISAQTADCLRKAARRFAWWLSVRKHLPVKADLFDDIPGFDPKHNRVHLRRACSPEELAHLLTTARASGAVYRGMTGEDRFFVYLIAFATGFRAGELTALSRASFALDKNPPVVVLKASETKNRRPVRQPLPLSVVNELRGYLGRRPAEGPLWPGTWSEKPVKMLKEDLAAAGIEYRVVTEDGPRFLDFHALRHTFISFLAAASVGMKELQLLARHSSPDLTLEVYTHSTAARLAESVQKLPLPAAGADVGGFAALSREALVTALVCSLTLNQALLGSLAQGQQ